MNHLAPNSSRVTLKNPLLCQEKEGKKRKKVSNSLCSKFITGKFVSESDSKGIRL